MKEKQNIVNESWKFFVSKLEAEYFLVFIELEK